MRRALCEARQTAHGLLTRASRNAHLTKSPCASSSSTAVRRPSSSPSSKPRTLKQFLHSAATASLATSVRPTRSLLSMAVPRPSQLPRSTPRSPSSSAPSHRSPRPTPSVTASSIPARRSATTSPSRRSCWRPSPRLVTSLRCTTLKRSSSSVPPCSAFPTPHTSPASTPSSTRQCPRRPQSTHCPHRFASRASAATASTDLAANPSCASWPYVAPSHSVSSSRTLAAVAASRHCRMAAPSIPPWASRPPAAW